MANPRAMAVWVLLAAALWPPLCHAQEPTAPVEIEVLGADLSLFPTAEQPAELEVRARKTQDVAGSLQCRVVLDNLTPGPTPGYASSPAVKLDLAEVGEWYTADFAITRETDPPPMTTGRLLVTGSVGGQSVRRDIPLRVGRGALAFRERREVQSPEGRKELDVACLENPQLRAEFVPKIGTQITLTSHRGRHDMLVPGDHALGLAWTGTSGWYRKTMSPCGPAVWAEFSARALGQSILLRASLGEGDDAVTLEYETGELSAAPGPLSLTSTLGKAGEDVALLPALAGPAEHALAGDPRLVTAGELRAQRFAIWNAALDETLQVSFSAQAFSALEVGQRQPWYDYALIHLDNGAPGKMTLRLSVAEGKSP